MTNLTRAESETPVPSSDVPTADAIARIAASMERTYLSPANATSRSLPDDLAPLHVTAVTALARPERPSEWRERAVPVVRALHEPGQALALALFGDGERQHLYLGGRRVIGEAASSTTAFLDRVTGVMEAEFVGLGVAARPMPIDHPNNLALGAFLATANTFAALTGVPNGESTGNEQAVWTLDRVARVAGRARFVALTVAEAVAEWVVTEQIAAMRQAIALVFPAVRRSVQQGWQRSESASLSMTKQSLDVPGGSEPGVDEVWRTLRRYGTMIPGIGASIMALQNFAGGTLTQQGQHGSGESGGETLERFDAAAEALVQRLQRRCERLQAALGSGVWRSVTYLVAEDDATIELLVAAYRGLLGAGGSGDEPLRVHRLTAAQARRTVAAGQILHFSGDADGAIATLVGARELAAAFHLPADDLLGLAAARTPVFGRSAPGVNDTSVHLGTLEDSAGRAVSEIGISAFALNRHTMVAGKTGFGKSNTCQQLLLDGWTRLRIPFLVLEPAKTEYRRLAQVPGLSGRLRVYAIGADSPLPLRLNPLSPVAGIPLARHIDLLKGVFNASFPMGAGMPYVLEDALHDLYRERGWNLATSQNPFLGRDATPDDLAALTPDLTDLYEQIEIVLNRKGYSAQIQSDLGAALRSRINSLRQGNKGVTLNARRSIPPADLFDEPSVIELTNLGDDEEKAFVMALLLVLLYEYGEVRHRTRPPEARAGLRHLTLVEEAHRLLKATHRAAAPESGDPATKAVTMFTDMLAEMRAYGEGFVIADQIPSDLAPQIIKNTDVKIVHRLTAPDDRTAMAQSIDLNEQQARHLTNLKPGMAVVHSEEIPSAVAVRVAPVTRERVRDLPAYQLRHFLEGIALEDRRYLQRHAGCRLCPKPGVFATQLEIEHQIPGAAALRTVFDGLLREDQQASWQAWLGWRAAFISTAISPTDEEQLAGFSYCAAVNAGYRWLIEQVTAPPVAAPTERASAPARSGRPPVRALPPARRLACDRIAGVWASWLWTWAKRVDLAEPAPAEFRQAQGALLDELVRGWPEAPAPCPRCGARCAVLPEVVLHLGALQPSVERTLATTLAPAAKLETIRQIMSQQLPVWPGGDNARAAQDHRISCLLANLHLPAATTTRADLLAYLQSSL